MKNRTIHIDLPSRTTTVTIHETLYHLISLKLTNEVDAYRRVREWLSQRCTDQLGDWPKSSGVRQNLSKYAVDIILSEVAQKELIDRYNNIRYPG